MLVADENLTLTAVGAINNSSSDMFGFLTGQYFGYQNQSGGLIGGKGLILRRRVLITLLDALSLRAVIPI
jgi:hypothetical protein